MFGGKQLLQQTKITELGVHVPKSDLITVKLDDPISTAFEKLVTKKIHALPVIDGSGCFSTFLDILDICHYAISVRIGFLVKCEGC